MEGPRLVLALPAVGTGRAATLVDVLLAPGACEPCRGGAGVVVVVGGGDGEGHLCSLHTSGSLLVTVWAELCRQDFMGSEKNGVYTDSLYVGTGMTAHREGRVWAG